MNVTGFHTHTKVATTQLMICTSSQVVDTVPSFAKPPLLLMVMVWYCLNVACSSQIGLQGFEKSKSK